MGVYLSIPKKEKDIMRKSNDQLEFVSIGMQGYLPFFFWIWLF